MLQEYCNGKLYVVALPRNIRVTGEPGRITNPSPPHPPLLYPRPTPLFPLRLDTFLQTLKVATQLYLLHTFFVISKSEQKQ